MGKRILGLDSFKQRHEEHDHALKRYLTSGWGRHHLGPELIEKISMESAHCLYAINARARIEFAAAAEELFRSIILSKNERIAFVTFTPDAAAVPLKRAQEFDHSALQRWSEEQLKDFQYIGMIEAAFFSTMEASVSLTDTPVSWHVHALVWGGRLSRLNSIAAEINRTMSALGPGTAADVRFFKHAGAVSRLSYMLKVPLKDYRIGRSIEHVDPETGEITGRNHEQLNKRDIRPGDAIKIYRVMGERTISMLAFGSSEGQVVVDKAIAVTKRRIAAEDAQREKARRRLLRTSPPRR